MTFDSVILAGIAFELNKSLAGGRVDAIHQPGPLDVVFTIRNARTNHMLLISADAQSPRVHLTSFKRPNPKTPPNFCMLLRKHLEGVRFVRADQLGFDRVLCMRFARRHANTVSTRELLTLIVEIMGKHSNIILANETGRILGAVKPVGRSKNRYREILPGREYVPPPSHGKINPLDMTTEQFDELLSKTFAGFALDAWLTNTFAGISPFTARELSLRSEGDTARLRDEFFALIKRIQTGDFAPVIISDADGHTMGFYAFPTVQHPASNQYERSSVNVVADIYYKVAIPMLSLEHSRQAFSARLTRELKARENALKKMEQAVTESQQAVRWKEIGELILSQVNSIPPKAESAQLIDYYDPAGTKITVKLDPSLDAAENAEAYFRKYQKANLTLETLKDRIDETRAEVELLKKACNSIASITSEDQIRQIEQTLAARGIVIRNQEQVDLHKEKAEFGGHKIKRVVSEGWEILVGQNSDANDYLLTRIASANDWWLHVKAAPGAHVIIRTNGKPERVSQSVMYLAAELAVEHSDSKHSSLVPVDYTLRKYVRKPRGAPPGKTLYEREKTIFVTPSDT